MNISKIISRQNLNANNIGSSNLQEKSISTQIESTSTFSNTSAIKKTNVDMNNASVVNNMQPFKIEDIRNLGIQKKNSMTRLQKYPLYQKYHGMPGVGITGTTGEQGEHGNSIYFGYINDFFKGVQINVGELLYSISERDGLGSAADRNYYNKLSSISFDAEIRPILNNIFNNDYTYTYVGSYIDYAPDYDVANEEKTMYNMLASLTGKKTLSLNTANLIVKENIDPNKEYRKYKINSNRSIEDIEISVYENEIPWDDNDAIADIIKNTTGGKVIKIKDIYPDDSSIIENSSFIEKIDSYNYIKEVQTLNDNNYVIGPNQFYAELSNTNYNQYKIDGYYLPINSDNIYYYIKQSFEIIRNLNDEEENNLFKGVVTSSSTGFFGLDYSQIFKIEDGNVRLESKSNILNTTGEQKSENLKKFITKYYTILNNYIDDLSTKGTEILDSSQSSFNRSITYYDTNNITLFVPSILSDYYKAGDTLYFYTTEADLNNPNAKININYMVCLTEDMLGCTKKELINYAQLTDPFTISRLKADGTRINCINNAAILKNLADSSVDKFFNKSCVNILDNYTDSALILANTDNTNKEFININVSLYNGNSSIYVLTDKNSVMHIGTKNILKLNDLYVNISNLSEDFNAELKSYIYDNNILFNDEAFISPLDNITSYINSTDNKLYAAGKIFCKKYFKNYNTDTNGNAIPYDGYIYGYDLYNKDFELISSNYSTSYELSINFELSDEIYYVQIYVANEGGMKFNSRISKITATFSNVEKTNPTYGSVLFQNMINNPSTYNVNVLTSISIDVLGQNTSFIPNNIGNKIIYSFSNIDVIGGDSSLKIYSEDPSVKIKNVLFDHESISSKETKISNWAAVTENTVNNSYTLTFKPNLPYDCQSLWDYACLDSSDYGNSIESSLFTKLDNNVTKDSCKQRSIKVTIEYEDGDDMYTKYQNFDIIQPGFTDMRDCPKISLDMHYGITDTQQYNTVENGVLCNQFITYMDINIENFKEYWNQYITDDCSVSMDITLQNIKSDIEWQSDNLISYDFINRATVKFLMTNEDTKSGKDMENYIKLNVIPFKTNSKLTSLNNNIINNTNIDVSVSTSLLQGPLSKYETADVSIVYLNNEDYKNEEYIILSNNILKNAADTKYIYKGIQKDFSIIIKDIKFDDFSDNTLKLKIMYEMGNPIISNLYLRFAVSDIKIHLTKGTDKITYYTSISANTDTSSYLKQYNSAYDYSYRFISDKLDVMFNPMSYIVCPNDAETTYSNIQGSIEKTGMNDEVYKSLRFYNSEVYNYSDLMSVTAVQSRDTYQYNWSSVLLKKRYLQDNIKNIMVSPISFDDIIGKDKTNPNIDPYNLFLYDVSIYKDTLNGYYLDTLAGDKYLAVVYNGALMNPKYRDDTYSFIYNGSTYELDRYSQKANNYPAWVLDECVMEMRSDALIKSMDAWNDEYNYVSSEMSDIDILFKGILSLYGNGYMHLPNTYDTGQYSDTGVYSDEQIQIDALNTRIDKINSINTASLKTTLLKNALISKANTLIESIKSDGTDIGTTDASKYKDVMSLKETKSQNDVYIYDNVAYDRIYGSAATKYEPEVYNYYRAFLYNINWIYPKYTNNSNVTPYRMVSGFDYLLNILLKSQFINDTQDIKNNYKEDFNNIYVNINDKVEYIDTSLNTPDHINPDKDPSTMISDAQESDAVKYYIKNWKLIENSIINLSTNINKLQYKDESDLASYLITIEEMNIIINNISTYINNAEQDAQTDYMKKQRVVNKIADIKEFSYDILDYISKWDNQFAIESTIQPYLDKFKKLNGSIDHITEMVPYNLLYSIYPRVAYNDEKNTLNCIMLRRPTIGTDTDIDSFNKCYIFKRDQMYINTISDIEYLKPPYTVK